MNDAMMEERDRAMLVRAEWVTMEVRWNGGKREERTRAPKYRNAGGTVAYGVPLGGLCVPLISVGSNLKQSGALSSMDISKMDKLDWRPF